MRSPAWTGPHCNIIAELDTVQLWPNPLLPLPSNPSRITDSWGVTVGRDPASNTWALYACVACVFAGGKPQPFSMHDSGIIAATAPALEGPYTYVGEFEGIFSEGPHMVAGPGGGAAWLLIQPGSNASRTPVVCSGDYRAAAAPRSAVGQGLTVNKTLWVAAAPGGPWSARSFNLSELGPLSYFSNPSIAFDKVTGELHLAYRVNLVEPVGRGETLGFATAPAWNASFQTLAEPIIPGLTGYEDPFVWVHYEHGRKILSILEHTQYNGSSVGGLFVSDDEGLTWVQSPLPAYTLSLNMAGGAGWEPGPLTALRRERPELVFDSETGSVTHLLTGMMVGGKGPNKDWELSYSIATRVGKRGNDS